MAQIRWISTWKYQSTPLSISNCSMSLTGVRMGRRLPNCTCKCPPPTPSGRLLQMGEARWRKISFQPWTNSGGGLGATCAWSIVPGSPEGEFKPILIHLLVTVHVKHLKQHFAKDNRYYLLRKHCYGQFFYCLFSIFEDFHSGKIGQVLFNFPKSLSRYFFPLACSSCPSPSMDPSRPMILWCSNPWFPSINITRLIPNLSQHQRI